MDFGFDDDDQKEVPTTSYAPRPLEENPNCAHGGDNLGDVRSLERPSSSLPNYCATVLVPGLFCELYKVYDKTRVAALR